jgi:hypothetical protein
MCQWEEMLPLDSYRLAFQVTIHAISTGILAVFLRIRVLVDKNEYDQFIQKQDNQRCVETGFQ